MSITITPPSFMSYEEWIKENPDIEKQEQECDECNGSGEVDCPHCGQPMDCENCDGTGVVFSAHDVYESQLRKDKKAWQNYFQKLLEQNA